MTTAVCIECCCLAGVLGPKIRTHHSTTPWRLWGLEKIRSWLCVLAFECLHGTVLWYLAETLQVLTRPYNLTTDNDPQFPQSPATCCHVNTDHSSYTTTDPWRSRISSCGCPCLEFSTSSVRDVQSLAAFQQQLQTVLFMTSFGNDANTWATSLSTCDCLLSVRWPCNVFTWLVRVCHWTTTGAMYLFRQCCTFAIFA